MTARFPEPVPARTFVVPLRSDGSLPRRRSLRPRESTSPPAVCSNFRRRGFFRADLRQFRLHRHPRWRQTAARSVAGRGPASGGARSLSGQMQGEPVSLFSKREQDCFRRFRPSGVGCAVRTNQPQLRLRRLLPHRLIRLFSSPARFSVSRRRPTFRRYRRLPLPPARSLPFLCRGRSILSLLGQPIQDDDSLASDDGPDEPDGDARRRG